MDQVQHSCSPHDVRLYHSRVQSADSTLKASNRLWLGREGVEGHAGLHAFVSENEGGDGKVTVEEVAGWEAFPDAMSMHGQ